MSTLTQIADGLQATLKTIPVLDQNVLKVVRRPHAYPAVILLPPSIPDYGLSLSGVGNELLVDGLLLTGSAEAEEQADLWPFMDWAGSSSIAAAILANPTLGVDANARLRSWDRPGLIELPDGAQAYGATFTVGIFAS